jgi:hypothetical protein
MVIKVAFNPEPLDGLYEHKATQRANKCYKQPFKLVIMQIIFQRADKLSINLRKFGFTLWIGGRQTIFLEVKFTSFLSLTDLGEGCHDPWVQQLARTGLDLWVVVRVAAVRKTLQTPIMAWIEAIVDK